MKFDFFNFVILVLAVDAIVVLWFKGSLFATYRARAEAWSDSNRFFLLRWLGKLLSCPLCLPPHIAYWLFVALTHNFIPSVQEGIFILAIAGSAIRTCNYIWPVIPVTSPWRYSNHD